MVLLLSACSAIDEDTSFELARVNSRVISIVDFERSYVNALLQSGVNDTPEGRWTHIDQLIDDQLLYEEAIRRGMDQDSITQGFDELTFKKALGGRYFEQAFLEHLPPLDEAAVRQAYARYKQPVFARHLVYRSEEEAQAAYQRLEAGRPFLEEAQDCFQTSEFDSLAGYLGEVRYFQVDDAFAEAAFALERGSWSSPVRGRHGFHIIMVEDRIAAPILTESDFQMRRNGMASLLRMRIRRLEGDRFVRSFMQDLDVQVDPSGIRSLQRALERMEARTGNAPVSVDDADDAGAQELAPETVLATYIQEGKEHTFTAQDYAFWLPDLPFAEAVSRTGASVGRALRNEAFASAGQYTGLGDSKEVREDVEAERRIFLSRQLWRQQQDSSLVRQLRSRASIRVDSTLFNQIMAL